MTKSIVQVLRHFQELEGYEPESELFLTRLDLERALLMVDFTDEEADTVRALFLVDPDRPSRDSKAGRPRGSNAHEYITQLMRESHKSENALNIMVSRHLHSACEKIAAFLGDDYA